MRLRLVDLSPYGIYPPRSGFHHLVHHTSRCLGARHDVFVFAMGLRRFDGLRWRSFVQRPEGRYVEYRHVTPVTYLSYVRRRRTGLPPLRAAATLRWTAPRALRRALAAADVVQVEGPWQYAYARAAAPGRPLVVVARDAEAALVAASGAPARLVTLARRIEATALRGASAVIFLSADDSAALAAAYELAPERCHVIGVGADTDALRPTAEDARDAAKTALGLAGPVAIFLGSWHLPNRSALAAVRALAPTMPGWTFLVVGSVGGRPEVSGNLHLTGPVAEVAPYLRAADVALNPMTEGSGVNLKMLDYLAMGLPTITTAFGTRGLDLGDAVVISALDNLGATLATLADPAERARRGRVARAVAESRFTWEQVARAREQVYRELVATSGRSSAPATPGDDPPPSR